MAHLIDVDAYNNSTGTEWSYGKRLFLDSNNILYCAFRNLNDELEIKRSYDGGQSWQHIVTHSLAEVSADKRDALYIGKKNGKICVIADWWGNSQWDDHWYSRIFWDDGNSEILDFYRLYSEHITIGGLCFLDNGDVGLISKYNFNGYAGNERTFILFDDGTASKETSNGIGYNGILHSYDEDLCLWSANGTNGYWFFYLRELNSLAFVNLGSYDDDRIQSWFKVIKISNNLAYFVAHEKDPDDGKYKVNLYKFEFDSSALTKIDTIVDTASVGDQPIIFGNYDMAKDGESNLYIMYVKPSPYDYLFMRKFDFSSQTLEAEQQITDFEVRLPQIVSSLPNSNRIFYTYIRKDS